MPKEAIFTLKLEPELRDQFLAEAEATHRPASQLVREFMRDFVKQQRAAREHDVWFRAEVEQALREADDPKAKRIPDERVASNWRRQRAELVRRAGEPDR
ncbi:MAG TPA: antitoxin of toxin-antitoxin stability system [Acetobacteraceae bacterium]|nr:antitoxin of toxin-antitoxin stability system [Acetobacteraceae bacterium]